jgi:integrase
MEVYKRMSSKRRPTGHTQVRPDKNGGGRSYYAFWYDQDGERGGRRLGPAHVRDSGRRTARGAIIWRACNGSRPTPEHLTPKDAEDRLEAILRELEAVAELPDAGEHQATLAHALQGSIAERERDKGLKRSTLVGYNSMVERMYRDLGADTPLQDFLDGRLRDYFADFRCYRVRSEQAAKKDRAEGKEVRRIEVARWTAQPQGSQAVEVATKAEAVKLADELPGTWKHRRRGAYRVVPLNAKRAKSVTFAQAKTLEAEGWIIARRKRKVWMLVQPASAQTRNEYRDVLSAAFDYAVREGWIEVNPLAAVKRSSKRLERERVLRRDDFYDRSEIDRLLAHAPGIFEEAFWLCGAHAGLRLPGEALGMRWGAVDFETGVIRPYDNWILGELDTTKTDDSEAIPMTPRFAHTLAKLKQRDYATADGDFVFAWELSPERPVPDRPLREAFRIARRQAGLKPIKMYNLRHSFGTRLAAKGVDVRTIQALMRHTRLSTTEQYMAYAPRPELANQIAQALDPESLPENVVPLRPRSGEAATAFFERLEEEIPAKWLAEVRRLYAETGALLTA